MAYEAQISRNSPTAFLFVVDQSGSMSDKMSSGKTKAEFVADALNRNLMNLVLRCTKSEGVRDYFEVGVIGYGGSSVSNGFSGVLGTKAINPISMIEQNPVRVEDRIRKMDDGAGGIVESTIKFPVWFEPKASGGTPMMEALSKAAEELVTWCDTHPDCYPPHRFTRHRWRIHRWRSRGDCQTSWSDPNERWRSSHLEHPCQHARNRSH